MCIKSYTDSLRLHYAAGTAEQSESGGGGWLKFSEVAILLYY